MGEPGYTPAHKGVSFRFTSMNRLITWLISRVQMASSPCLFAASRRIAGQSESCCHHQRRACMQR
jgi:hypothetical protein